MSLTDTIRAEMTAAWRAGDTGRRDTFRLLIAAFENARIAAGHPLTDDEALQVLRREARQRRDSIEAFTTGGRDDLAARERAELDIIASFLPAELADDELAALIRAAIEDAQASGPGDIGRVMGPLMQQVAGRADGRRVNALARELLGG